MGNFRALITVEISSSNLILIVIICGPDSINTEYRNGLCQVKKKRSLAPLPFKLRAQYYWKSSAERNTKSCKPPSAWAGASPIERDAWVYSQVHNFHYSTILVLEPELLGTVQDVGCSGEFNCKLKRGLVTAWSRKAKVGRVFTKAPTSQELYKQATWDNTVTAPPWPQQIHLNRCSLECWEPHTCSALVNGIFLLQLNGCHISMSSRIVLCFTSKSSGKLPSVEHQTKRILESGQRKKHTHTHTHLSLFPYSSHISVWPGAMTL